MPAREGDAAMRQRPRGNEYISALAIVASSISCAEMLAMAWLDFAKAGNVWAHAAAVFALLAVVMVLLRWFIPHDWY